MQEEEVHDVGLVNCVENGGQVDQEHHSSGHSHEPGLLHLVVKQVLHEFSLEQLRILTFISKGKQHFNRVFGSRSLVALDCVNDDLHRLLFSLAGIAFKEPVIWFASGLAAQLPKRRESLDVFFQSDHLVNLFSRLKLL